MSFSFRLFAGLFAAWVLALAMGPLVIPALRRLKLGQAIRDVGPQSHLAKQGTPTMGGIIFLVPAAVSALAFVPRDGHAWLMVVTALAVTLANGLIGFADDYIKVALRRPLGLRAREKLVLQVLIALGLAYMAARVFDLGTHVIVPYVGWRLELGLFYYPFVVLVALATANALNLTDGLDGLAAGLSVLAFAFYGLAALVLAAPTVLAGFSFALAGATAGFLRYNAHPARVFMGDTGSLALGGALAAVAVLTRTELLLPVVGLVFVLETLSVILQVLSFRLTGRRIFRMSPLHHHFELLGWPETTVVRRFWLAGCLAAALAWLGLPSLVS